MYLAFSITSQQRQMLCHLSKMKKKNAISQNACGLCYTIKLYWYWFEIIIFKWNWILINWWMNWLKVVMEQSYNPIKRSQRYFTIKHSYNWQTSNTYMYYVYINSGIEKYLFMLRDNNYIKMISSILTLTPTLRKVYGD